MNHQVIISKQQFEEYQTLKKREQDNVEITCIECSNELYTGECKLFTFITTDREPDKRLVKLFLEQNEIMKKQLQKLQYKLETIRSKWWAKFILK